MNFRHLNMEINQLMPKVNTKFLLFLVLLLTSVASGLYFEKSLYAVDQEELKEKAKKKEEEQMAKLKAEREAKEKAKGKFIPKAEFPTAEDAAKIEIKKEDYQKKFKALKEKEEKLLEKEKFLAKTEERLVKKLAEIKKTKKEYEDSLAKEANLKKDRLKKLVQMYSKMDVKKAAPAFEKMDLNLAIQLLLHLKESVVSKLFEKMSTDKVVEYSEELARIRSGKKLPTSR